MRAAAMRRLIYHPLTQVAAAIVIVLGAAAPSCGGSSSAPATSGNAPILNTAPATNGENLSESDVNTIVLQAIHEANARGKPATIAVVDRVGNVLTVAQMSGAPTSATITSGRGITGGLEGVAVPTTLAAISKAMTAAYLSSNANAFSSRTANQIIQEHFDPGVKGAPGGPLFGVQFSQLSCSDFNTVAATAPGATNAGPHRSPLGFAADSGGLPIYKNGVLVGGIGVMTKNTYSADANIFDVDVDDDEVIAIAGVTGYEAPAGIRAENISLLGNTLRYTDASSADLAAPVEATGSFTPVVVPGYFAGPASGHTAIAGLTYDSADGASGIAPDGALGPAIYPGTAHTAAVFTDGNGHILDQPRAGLMPATGAITAAEAQGLVTSALNVAFSARAAIRQPAGNFAQVTVTITDLDGNVLAQARTPDAPVFGADVSRQKARTAAFFSRPDAAAKIDAISAAASTAPGTFADYITRTQQLMGLPDVFADGLAWSEVSIGNIARPFYPDGIDGNPPGSLSLAFATRWSQFSTGLQTDLIKSDILAGAGGSPPPAVGCGHINGKGLPIVASSHKTELANGMQIFAGSLPIYRGNTLVGGIGVSGDGIQQDSLIAFLGLQNGPSTLNNAPASLRIDSVKLPDGTRLRYVNCPADPFLDSHVQNPC